MAMIAPDLPGPTTDPDAALDALLAGTAPDPRAAVRAVFGEQHGTKNVLRSVDALLARGLPASDVRLTLTLVAAAAPALESDHIARLLTNRVVTSGGLPWRPIRIAELRPHATTALSHYAPDRAVRVVDDLLARQQRDALRYVPEARWTPEMVATSLAIDDDISNLDRIRGRGAVEPDDLAWLQRRGRHLAEDGWISDSPVGEIIVRTAPPDLVAELLAIDPPTNRSVFALVFARDDLPAQTYREALRAVVDSRVLLAGTSLDDEWTDALQRALAKPDLWDLSVPVEDRGRAVSNLPTATTRFAAIVPGDALAAFVDRLLPGAPGSDTFVAATERLSRFDEDRLLSATRNRAMTRASADKLRAWHPDARRVLARRTTPPGQSPTDHVSALRSLGNSLLRGVTKERARDSQPAPTAPPNLFELLSAGQPLSEEQWVRACASADPEVRARVAVHPEAPAGMTVTALSEQRVRSVAAAVGEFAFPEAPRAWSDLPTRPDLFASNDPTFAIDGQTVSVLGEHFTVRLISAASQLEANADYMGNCTEGYRQDIEDGSARLVQLVDTKGKVRYNVEFSLHEGTWKLGEVNSRHNRGADPAVTAAVGPLAETLTTAMRWFASPTTTRARADSAPVVGD